MVKSRILSILMATMVVLGCSTFVLAESSEVEQSGTVIVLEDAPIISHEEEWVTPDKHVEIIERDLGDGFTAVETETLEYPRSRASGTVTKTKSVEVKDGTVLISTIKVSGSFKFDGSKATVTSYSQSYTTPKQSTIYTMSKFAKATGDSGLLNNAYVKADYKLTKIAFGTTVSSGKVEVTCNKNGN